MNPADDLRVVANTMEGWQHRDLLLEAADTLDRQARVMRELLTERDAEIARLRRELTSMTEAWHEAQRQGRVPPPPFDWHSEVNDR